MDFRLLLIQIDEIVVDDQLRQLIEHLFLATADDQRLQLLVQFIETHIALDIAFFPTIEEKVVGGKPPQRAEQIGIEELNQRVDIFKLVLKRCAGEDDGMLTRQALDRLSRLGLEILDALRLVKDDDIRLEPGDDRHIAQDRLIIGDLEQARGRVGTVPCGPWRNRQ